MSSQKASYMYKSQKLVRHIWHRIYSPQYDRQMDIKYIGILRKFHEIFSTFFREFTETCLVHLTRYLDLGLAAKDVKLSFWGQQYCFQMFIWWLGLALLQIMNWRCISVVNPNNNLRSLKRWLSATLLFVAILMLMLCIQLFPLWKTSLAILMERMTAANPHFIRCIKPNTEKVLLLIALDKWFEIICSVLLQ